MDTQKYVNIFKALSNKNRFELFLEIVKSQEKNFETNECHGCLIADIAKYFQIGAPTVSHHLKELSNANLILIEKKGKNLIAKANTDVMKEVGELFLKG